MWLCVFQSPAFGDAICNDGWESTSEGSGTCSHHGGVAQWLPDVQLVPNTWATPVYTYPLPVVTIPTYSPTYTIPIPQYTYPTTKYTVPVIFPTVAPQKMANPPQIPTPAMGTGSTSNSDDSQQNTNSLLGVAVIGVILWAIFGKKSTY